MNTTFIRTARRSSLAQIRHVRPVPPAAAPELVLRVYAQVERDFGMLAPPIGMHASAPEVLAAAWLMLRETLVASGSVDRATKEAVGTAVSERNTCPYCVVVHSTTLRGLGGSGAGTAVVEWARASARRDPPAVPVPAEQAPEVIGTAVTFDYLNRMVNLFLRESPFPPGLPRPARGGLMRLLTWVLRPVTRRSQRPGDSLELLPAAPLPDDLAWAAGNPDVAGAFARAAAAIEAAGRRSVPDSVRDLVTATLAGWDGEPPGLSRSWVADAVSGLPAADRPAGRLALLTALASYQIDEPVIEDFRRDHPADQTVVELTAWASLAAARRVGRIQQSILIERTDS